MIQSACVVGREVVLAPHGMLKDFLVKSGVGNCLGAGTGVGRRSPYPSHFGSNVLQRRASRSSDTHQRNPEVCWRVSAAVWSVRKGQQSVCWNRSSVVTESHRWQPVKWHSWVLNASASDGEVPRQAKIPNRDVQVVSTKPLIAHSSKQKSKEEWRFHRRDVGNSSFCFSFATGPNENPKNKHCIFCMRCKQNLKVASQGSSQLRRHFDDDGHLRADKRYREKYFNRRFLVKNARVLYGMNFDVPEFDQNAFNFLMLWSRSLLHLLVGVTRQ